LKNKNQWRDVLKKTLNTTFPIVYFEFYVFKMDLLMKKNSMLFFASNPGRYSVRSSKCGAFLKETAAGKNILHGAL